MGATVRPPADRDSAANESKTFRSSAPLHRRHAVFLTYAAPRGHALIDRPLYLPRSWVADRDRCAAAGTPTKRTVSQPNPRWLANLIARAVQAGVPATWVAGDEVYGADPTLAGPFRVDALPAMLTPRAWQKHSAGPGAKDHRIYSWAWLALLPEDPADTGQHHC